LGKDLSLLHACFAFGFARHTAHDIVVIEYTLDFPLSAFNSSASTSGKEELILHSRQLLVPFRMPFSTFSRAMFESGDESLTE
jgi:hypothetical protein